MLTAIGQQPNPQCIKEQIAQLVPELYTTDYLLRARVMLSGILEFSVILSVGVVLWNPSNDWSSKAITLYHHQGDYSKSVGDSATRIIQNSLDRPAVKAVWLCSHPKGYSMRDGTFNYIPIYL